MPSQPSSPKPRAKHSFSFPATGTTWSVDIYDPVLPKVITEIQGAVIDRVRSFEDIYSRFKPNSFVSQLARHAGTYDLPVDAPRMLNLYQDLYQITGGLMTPLIGQTLSDTGYDTSYSFQAKSSIQSPPRWEDTLEYSITDQTITMKQAAQLDFGAVGKGYLVDIISELLHDRGITSYVVDAGGDMFIQSLDNPLTIGLEDPQNTQAVLGTAEISLGALCGSAGNRRRWGNYHHIINPSSLKSPEHILAAWVFTESTMLADGLTTCLFLVPATTLQKQFAFEYILVMDKGSVEISAGFPAKIFT